LGSLVDQASGLEFVPARAGRHAVVLDDDTDTWSHGVRSFRHVAGHFSVRRVERVEDGPVRGAIRVVSGYGASTLIEEIRLDAGARHLEVAVTLDWREHLAALKLRFPAAVQDATATHEIAYGHLARPANGDESPSHRWVDVSGSVDGQPGGVSLLNDGKYSFDVSGAEIGLMAARSPVYAWHEPATLDPDEIYTWQDQGTQRFTYRLLPHRGDWRDAQTPRAAAMLNEKPTVLLESTHGGPFPAERSYGSDSAGSVVMAVVKAGEDDPDAIVVRAYESEGRAAEATIDLPFCGRSFSASFAPSEIKTFLAPADPEQPVVETDLLERPMSEGR
jgi:alpha-mannosidase